MSAAWAEHAADNPNPHPVAVMNLFRAEERNERLSQLVARYDAAKSAAAAAAAELKAITDGIKAELTAVRPGAEIIDVVSPDLALPLRLQVVEAWRVDAKRLKAEQPAVYVAYAKPSIAWRLEAIKGA